MPAPPTEPPMMDETEQHVVSQSRTNLLLLRIYYTQEFVISLNNKGKEIIIIIINENVH